MIGGLVRYEQARAALAHCATVDEAKDIENKAEALQVYARMSKDFELETWAAAIRLRAIRRIGELSRGLEKAHKAGRGKGVLQLPRRGSCKTEVLEAAGLSTQSASRYERVAEIPQEEFDRHIEESTSKGKAATLRELLSKVARKERNRRKKTAKPSPLPEGQFRPILADPPWQYDFSETEARQLELNQYSTMPLEQIKRLPVPAGPDCILFLWATAPKLREGLAVMEAWGFEFKTFAVWDKEIIGMGYWFRGQHEPILLGTRGKAEPPANDLVPSSVIRSRRGKHSAKPDAVYDPIEAMFPAFGSSDRVELFARKKRPGWTSWGNEI
jgi:N6-adenosine-specific RNA methylase IME4